MPQLLPIIVLLASFIGNMVNVNLTTPKNERQQSINSCVCCIVCDPRAIVRLLRIIEVLATSKGNIVHDIVATPEDDY
jgi:hypothetical protein